MRILVTGGAGFVGSSLALSLAGTPGNTVVALDNLKRRGSELAPARLAAGGVAFVHGDVRNPEDFEAAGAVDLIIDCAAEPSVQAGLDGQARYLVATNLVGTFNALELARRNRAGFILLSTSRVYSIEALRALPLAPAAERLVLPAGAAGPGWSESGIAPDFPTSGARSLYGTTKLASELLVEEYGALWDLPVVIDRCGVIAGPWQMGRVDQGFFVLWAARHAYRRPLRYTGFGGKGMQVRDVLHIADLADLVALQVAGLDRLRGRIFNVGGGPDRSVSLRELTRLCAAATGTSLAIDEVADSHKVDLPWYVSDNRAVTAATGWEPVRGIERILADVLDWIAAHRTALAPILDPGGG
jgi:CDP-paratose 2-epimerase